MLPILNGSPNEMRETLYKSKRIGEIACDIDRIEEAIENDQLLELSHVHRYIDGKYQSAIVNWGRGLYWYNKEYGIDYDQISKDEIIHNLHMMSAKLEGFMNDWNAANTSQNLPNTSAVNVTVNNTVNVSISFEEVRQKIEDMTALSREQTDEILEKINQLEAISKEDSPRKTKWERVKPIIAAVLDKGVDIVIPILSLILQMKLGM